MHEVTRTYYFFSFFLSYKRQINAAFIALFDFPLLFIYFPFLILVLFYNSNANLTAIRNTYSISSRLNLRGVLDPWRMWIGVAIYLLLAWTGEQIYRSWVQQSFCRLFFSRSKGLPSCARMRTVARIDNTTIYIIIVVNCTSNFSAWGE